jgi:hypothetical protein
LRCDEVHSVASVRAVHEPPLPDHPYNPCDAKIAAPERESALLEELMPGRLSVEGLEPTAS